MFVSPLYLKPRKKIFETSLHQNDNKFPNMSDSCNGNDFKKLHVTQKTMDLKAWKMYSSGVSKTEVDGFRDVGNFFLASTRV